jgi:hypothetical protein
MKTTHWWGVKREPRARRASACVLGHARCYNRMRAQHAADVRVPQWRERGGGVRKACTCGGQPTVWRGGQKAEVTKAWLLMEAYWARKCSGFRCGGKLHGPMQSMRWSCAFRGERERVSVLVSPYLAQSSIRHHIRRTIG